MALSGTEFWSRGFVFDGAVLAVAASPVGARDWSGFLRDADGRLVTTASGGSYDRGFMRLDGALVVAGGASTPRLYPFA